ncbi:MAG TPA: 3-isopropylmalate dehydratase large subunit [Bacteroidaceae bacterium]|nr:3-isopropylmalate dehydratase large subunit [Bacteroidaceae bacterium]
MGKTIFEKIWGQHKVDSIEGGPDILFIDKQFIHEVTSPQAFEGLRNRKTGVRRPDRVVATTDHNVPTIDQHLPIQEELSRLQVSKLEENCKEFGIDFYGLSHPYQGIVHIIGPELGITQPGMTIVCGDSHTSTHGALGTVAFGIGTSEVEMVLATQCILQYKPMTMRINIDGKPGKGVTSKDIILYVISKLTASGGTGYFIEYSGSTISSLSMEARMTICNMSIEMGARGGIIAPDQVTFNYIKGRKFAPEKENWSKKEKEWSQLFSDPDARFDKEYSFKAEDIEPMVTFGTNPGMGIGISEHIPFDLDESDKSLQYMGFMPGDQLLNKPIDYVFLGSCTNGRIEDFRAFTSIVKGRKKADNVTSYLVPGSKLVEAQIKDEGIDKILNNAGFELRQAGCSACLAMNEDKVPEGKYCVSTSNRNFEGRQGPGSRTILASPLTAAASALTGKITDPRVFI